MSTKRRIGVSAASTEAARRLLMQPVPCWEKTWVLPDGASASTTFRVYKWVKTEKTQQFSDDEGETDEPLAPLPDEPEMVDGDEEIEQDEPPAAIAESIPAVVVEPAEDVPKEPSPTPLLTMTSESAINESSELEPSLKLMENIIGDVDVKLNSDGGVELDIETLGPDGLTFQDASDLTQLEQDDALLGGPLMDQTEDPFSTTIEDP